MTRSIRRTIKLVFVVVVIAATFLDTASAGRWRSRCVCICPPNPCPPAPCAPAHMDCGSPVVSGPIVAGSECCGSSTHTPIVEGASIGGGAGSVDVPPTIEVAPMSESHSPMAGSKDGEAKPKTPGDSKPVEPEDMPMGNTVKPADEVKKPEPTPPKDDDDDLFNSEPEKAPTESPTQPDANKPDEDDAVGSPDDDATEQPASPDAKKPEEDEDLFGSGTGDTEMPADDADAAGVGDAGDPGAGDTEDVAPGAGEDEPAAGGADPDAAGGDGLFEDPAADPPADNPADPADAPAEGDDPFGAAEKPQSVKLATRVWIDNTGTFAVRARLASVRDDSVRLLKDTGKYTTVPMARLSRADRDYVAQLVAQYGKAAIGQLASR